jgi:hypothetical protein
LYWYGRDEENSGRSFGMREGSRGRDAENGREEIS